MEREALKDLLERYSEGQCTERERAWVEDWYNNYHLQADEPYTHEQIEADSRAMWTGLPQPGRKLIHQKWFKYATIAAVLVVGYLLYYLLVYIEMSKRPQPTHAQLEQVLPGGNRATLTLANGRVIALNDASNGVLAEQQGLTIRKNAEGQLVYIISKKDVKTDYPKEESVNTITTPKGGQYQVQLPDGSKVWLNAASSLSYTTGAYVANKREVRLSGEAYFEVAHNAKRPFIVVTDKQQVEVLGTHFNVSSYADNGATTTTLLQGKVRVSALPQPKGELSQPNLQRDGVVLKPGEAATLQYQQLSVAQADVELATAWKNGRIEFRDASLPQIMLMIGRWYNINIRFEGTLPPRRFSGSIPNNKNLYRVLEALQLGNVNFELLDNDNGQRTLLLKP